MRKRILELTLPSLISAIFLGVVFQLFIWNAQGLPVAADDDFMQKESWISGLTAQDYENGRKLESRKHDFEVEVSEAVIIKKIPIPGRNAGYRVRNVKWPNATLYYRIARGFTAMERATIARGMCEIEINSCVRFKPAITENNNTSPKNVVNIIKSGQSKGPDCWSYLGMVTRVGGQNLKMAATCFGRLGVGVMIHEFLHALGFLHEHARNDRDEYLRIHLENIEESWLPEYEIYDSPTGNYKGKYDYGSVMHYSPNGGVKQNGKFAFTPKKPVPVGVKIGQRNNLSAEDKMKLNRWYNCDKALPTSPNPACT